MFSTADSKLQGVENVQLGSGSSVTLTGQTEGFNVIGGGGAETIITSAGDDTINAGLGNDFIQAAAGADVINGGAGLDTVSYADVTGATSHGEAAITGMAVNFSNVSIADADLQDDIGATEGTANIVTGNDDPNAALAAGTVQYLTAGKGGADEYAIDTITSIEGFVGSALNDYIVLGADAVTVDAGAGADVIFSGTAADNINAGSGDDFILIGSSSDHGAAETIEGGTGDDTIVFTSFLGETLVLSANVTGVETARIELTGTEQTANVAERQNTNENIDASALTAGIALVGNGGNNILTGSAFADTFAAGAGDDRMIVDDADTSVDGEGGADTMVLAANATFTAAQLQNVETAELASGVALTVDHTDVLGVNNLATVTGVNDAATETLIVNGAALGVIATKDFGGLTLNNVSLDYRGGVGSDNITGTASADVISGGFGVDILNGNGGSDTLTGGEGSDTFTVEGNDSETNIVVITDFEATAAGDTLNLVNSDIAAASGAVTTARQDIDGGPVTRADGVTIESFSVTATGEVTLFDTNTALGTTTQVFAQTAADVVAITEALHLNIGVANVVTFGLDADANGTAESTIVASTDVLTGETNIVQLSNVAFGVDLGNTGLAANTINIDTIGSFNVVTADPTHVLTGTAGPDSFEVDFTAAAANAQTIGVNPSVGGSNFEVGVDRIDFTNTSPVANVANPTRIQEVTLDGDNAVDTYFANSGLVIVSAGDVAVGGATAAVATLLADLDGVGNDSDVLAFASDTSAFLLAVDDGADTYIYQAVATAGDQVVDAAELTLLVTIVGVTDVSTLTATHFADFV